MLITKHIQLCRRGTIVFFLTTQGISLPPSIQFLLTQGANFCVNFYITKISFVGWNNEQKVLYSRTWIPREELNNIKIQLYCTDACEMFSCWLLRRVDTKQQFWRSNVPILRIFFIYALIFNAVLPYQPKLLWSISPFQFFFCVIIALYWMLLYH